MEVGGRFEHLSLQFRRKDRRGIRAHGGTQDIDIIGSRGPYMYSFGTVRWQPSISANRRRAASRSQV
jgi:hypothetical protein